MTTESVTLYIVRTHRGAAAWDYHSSADLEKARDVAADVRVGRYPPDRVEIIEQTVTTSERAIE